MRVPGSSANLGPGYDAVGLALGYYDEVQVTVLDSGNGSSRPGAEVLVESGHRDEIPCDETNLVVRSLRAAWSRLGVRQPVIRLHARPGVPFGRGIGSSAAAVVSGVVSARELLTDPGRLDGDTALTVASDIEGHPDNVAASLFGGMTLGWSGPGGTRCVRIEPHPELRAVVAVPAFQSATAKARAMLPATVPHADAAFTAGRAALLVEAMTRRPDLLLPATADRLHQAYRAAAMPSAAELVERLRGQGYAAVVSGAGPSVLVLGTADELSGNSIAQLAGPQWQVADPGIDRDGATVLGQPSATDV